jgi:hypothetical protein
MDNEKNLEKRKSFSTENQPAKRGRRRSQLGDFITENEVSLKDLKTVLMGIVFDRSVTELEALQKDKTIPATVSFITKHWSNTPQLAAENWGCGGFVLPHT